MLVCPSNDGTQPPSTIFSTSEPMEKVGQGLPVRPSSMVQCHLHITLGPSRRWYSMVQYHLWKGGPACSSKLNGTTVPSSPHSRSEPTPTSPRIQLTAVSRLCPLLPFSRFSSLRCSLLPPFFSLLPPFSRTPQNTSTPKKGL